MHSKREMMTNLEWKMRHGNYNTQYLLNWWIYIVDNYILDNDYNWLQFYHFLGSNKMVCLKLSKKHGRCKFQNLVFSPDLINFFSRYFYHRFGLGLSTIC